MARPGERADHARERVDEALEAALASTDGGPRCEACANQADFFLYEPDRIRTFACWEHVSPISAVVDEGGTPDRPLAVPLSEEFE